MTTENHHSDSVISFGQAERIIQLEQHPAILRVARLRAIEHHSRNPAFIKRLSRQEPILRKLRHNFLRSLLGALTSAPGSGYSVSSQRLPV
jgi:hypothetical protein